MGVKVRIKNRHFYLDVIQNRKHHWQSLHMELSDDPVERKEQKRMAEVARAKREMQIFCGEWDVHFIQSEKISLLEYIDDALIKKMPGQTPPKDVNWPYVYHLRGLKKYLASFKFKDVYLGAITANWLESAREYFLTSTGLSRTSASEYFSTLCRFINKAEKDGLISKNPVRLVKKISIPEHNFPTLSANDLNVLKATAVPSRKRFGDVVRRAFLFSCYTGLRMIDIRTLLWQDIDLRPILGYTKVPHVIKKRQVKTGRLVEVPVVDSAWAILKDYRSAALAQNPGQGLCGAVFPYIPCELTVNLTIKSWTQKAGIAKHVTFHTARRTFATLQLESGVDPFTISRLLGHTTVGMTAKYAKSERLKDDAVLSLERTMNTTF